jgi:hypothetical protein
MLLLSQLELDQVWSCFKIHHDHDAGNDLLFLDNEGLLNISPA